MRFSKLLMVGTVSLFTLPWLMALNTGTAQAQEVRWERIVGIVQTEDVVGSGPFQPLSGPGSALGAIPWNTTEGSAEVDLGNGDIEFEVKGLVLSVGSTPVLPGVHLPIGTTGGVPSVKGTLVCDLNGSAVGSGGKSVLVDTPTVPLSPQGDAEFSGNVVIPSVCITEPDIAFLIRNGSGPFVGRYFAFGAVRIP